VGAGERDKPSVCNLFHRASELIGRRWTGAIIFVLLRDRCRFADLRAGIPGITDRMLSERLQELEEEGIVERLVIPETPVRVEYSLSAKGRALAKPVEAIGHWAHDWLADTRSAAGPVRRQPRGKRSARPARGRVDGARSRH
jgi:DNA-binding HxlR family transcriptional regulator